MYRNAKRANVTIMLQIFLFDNTLLFLAIFGTKKDKRTKDNIILFEVLLLIQQNLYGQYFVKTSISIHLMCYTIIHIDRYYVKP